MTEEEKKTELQRITEGLAAPFMKKVGNNTFPAHKWLPKDGKSMRDKIICMAYISGGQVKDRLNEVMGLNGWQFSSKLEPDGTRTGSLSLYICGEWITKDGTGTKSQQEAEKGAETDSLKRAARNFGIGAYLDNLNQHFQSAKNGKPVDKSGKVLYGDRLHNYINGISTNLGHLIQIVTDDRPVWDLPEFQVIYNRYK